MRCSFFFIYLFAWTATAHAASYEARSPRHAITVNIVSLGGDDVRYDATITDVVTGDVLASEQMNARRGETAGGNINVRDLLIRIRVAEESRFMASVEIQQGDVVIDRIDAYWSTSPRQIEKVTTARGGALKVEGDVKAPVVIKRVEPFYSEKAKKAGIGGVVIIEVTIDRSGTVKPPYVVLKPLPFGLDLAAVEAVKRWKFKPATLKGKPVDVVFNITVAFKLDTASPQPH
jgi:TonB family protein